MTDAIMTTFEQRLRLLAEHSERWQEMRIQSPWGTVQFSYVMPVDGMYQVSTAGHGGLWLAQRCVALLPSPLQAFRSDFHGGSPRWWEEDCEAGLVALCFPGLLVKPGHMEGIIHMLHSIYPHLVSEHGAILPARRIAL